MNAQTTDLPLDFHRSLMDYCYAFGLALMPQRLRDADFQLSPAGEVKVNDRPALGLRVSRKGWPDVNVYFDKESGLVVKAATREGAGHQAGGDGGIVVQRLPGVRRPPGVHQDDLAVGWQNGAGPGVE